jgi:methionyl-tRNA synthetase
MASTRQWCDKNNEPFDEWWKNPQTEVHHFIGKDIQYFHCLFWPAMLKTAGFNLPEKVHIHGFLTVNGRKMSKRDGTFVMAATYLNHLNPTYLRYYYAAKLGPRLDDIDMNLDEFQAKVDADLVNKVVNLASRSAKFTADTGLSTEYPDDGGLFQQGAAVSEEIASAYESCNYNRAMRLIMELADRANPYFDDAAPWVLRKDPEQAQKVQDICTVALNLYRQIMVYLSPVVPELAAKTEVLLGTPIAHWDDAQTPLTGTPVAKFKHMLKRVNEKDIKAMVEESKELAAAAGVDAASETADNAAADPTASTDSDAPLKAEPLAEQCTFDDFVKVDLRIVRIVAAEDVPEANKLLRLTLSLGGEERHTVLAGIKQAYKPEDLVGRLVVMCANLAPRKMKFGVSEGMILASGDGGQEVFMLRVDEGGQPGQRVH